VGFDELEELFGFPVFVPLFVPPSIIVDPESVYLLPVDLELLFAGPLDFGLLDGGTRPMGVYDGGDEVGFDP
jgi:hypothetical protein